ncbi:hypothetical protein QJQ45_011654, partial [Haematococcus lacustris]
MARKKRPTGVGGPRAVPEDPDFDIVDRDEAGQPDLTEAQRKRKASGEARAARSRDNTFHARKAKLAHLIDHLPQALWDAFLDKALDAQGQPLSYTDTDIPVSAADIPDLNCDNLFRKLCRGLPGEGENTRPSAAVAAVLAAHPDLCARLEAIPRHLSDTNMVDHVGQQLQTAFGNILTLLFAGRLKKSVSLAGAKVLLGTNEHQRRFGPCPARPTTLFQLPIHLVAMVWERLGPYSRSSLRCACTELRQLVDQHCILRLTAVLVSASGPQQQLDCLSGLISRLHSLHHLSVALLPGMAGLPAVSMVRQLAGAVSSELVSLQLDVRYQELSPALVEAVAEQFPYLTSLEITGLGYNRPGSKAPPRPLRPLIEGGALQHLAISATPAYKLKLECLKSWCSGSSSWSSRSHLGQHSTATTAPTLPPSSGGASSSSSSSNSSPLTTSAGSSNHPNRVLSLQPNGPTNVNDPSLAVRGGGRGGSRPVQATRPTMDGMGWLSTRSTGTTSIAAMHTGAMRSVFTSACHVLQAS